MTEMELKWCEKKTMWVKGGKEKKHEEKKEREKERESICGKFEDIKK